MTHYPHSICDDRVMLREIRASEVFATASLKPDGPKLQWNNPLVHIDKLIQPHQRAN